MRNLSIPPENKELFRGRGVVEQAMKLGKKSKNAPVKFECVRCVKGLLIDHDEGFEEEFYNNGGLDFLLEADATCSEEPALRVALEGGRLWVRLLENEKRFGELVAARFVDEEEEGGVKEVGEGEGEEKKEEVVGGGIESPLMKLLETKFDLLQAEGAKGCYLLFKGGYRPQNTKLYRRLAELLLDSDKVGVRSWCGRALGEFAKQEGEGEKKRGVEVLKEDEEVNVGDLIGALGTLVFEEEAKEELGGLVKVLKE